MCSPDNLMIEMGVGRCMGLQPLFKGCLYAEFMNIYYKDWLCFLLFAIVGLMLG